MSTILQTADRRISRRDVLKLTAAAAMLPLELCRRRRHQRRVIVAGGGIGGLSCGWELLRRGHDVTVLEPSDAPAGTCSPSARGSTTAFTWTAARSTSPSPGTIVTGRTINEFDAGASLLPAPRTDPCDGSTARCSRPRCYADPKVLDGMGFNRREVDYIVSETSWGELAALYYKPYLDTFRTSTSRSMRASITWTPHHHGSVQEGRGLGGGVEPRGRSAARRCSPSGTPPS